MMPMFAPVFVVRLRPQYGDGIRGLRRFLKAALRSYGLRCIGASTEESKISGPRSRRGARRCSRFGNPSNQEIYVMDRLNLEKLKQFAATTKSQMAFGGCPFIRWDYKKGQYLVGKDHADFTGKKLVADVGNVMGGYQKLEAGEKPLYALTKILDPTVEPIERAELGQTDESRWTDGKDPWVGATVLPFFDEATRAVYILIATFAARSETSALIHAFVEHSENNPEAADQLPIVTLCAREYVKGDGTSGFAMQLDIAGWTERPKAVLVVEPPPLSITTTEAKGSLKTAAAGDGQQVAAPTPDKVTIDDQATATPKRKIAIPGKPDIDDEIPF
jgi:hypothetical protein